MTDPFAAPWNRRALLCASGAGASAGLLLTAVRAAGLSARPLFTLGVASGEPLPQGFVLWTRLAPEPLAIDGGMPARTVPVRWEVAEDAAFRRVAARGTALAEPRWGHSVHVEVAGLRPDRPYWYRFLANGEASPIGRTRTAPAADQPVDRLRFCFASCQKYEAGQYAGHRLIAAEAPDLVVFLGDYIYENGPQQDVRIHRNPEPVDLGGYRVRYATYKTDPLLQAAHHAAPWAVIWDDHEVANDYADAVDEDNGDPAAFLRRRAAAYQAYWEHMPLRRASMPQGPAMQLYRSLQWGRLAAFQLVDDRQYRSARPCQPPELAAQHRPYRTRTPDCPERRDPARSILGAAQERWLHDAFAQSRAQWNLLAQQTLMADAPRLNPAHLDAAPDQYTLDNWGGYPATRERILRHWRDAKLANPLVLSGDIHAFAAVDLLDPDRPDAPPIASEFVGGSLTSKNHDPLFKQSAARTPGFRFAEHQVRGYASATMTPAECAIRFVGLEDPANPDSPARTLAHFTVAAGQRGMRVG
ncbi:alkaline phosphatase D family protein [Sphingomonas azotifigens]|uniref:alkaline phosphatase D family protein n=1 Tax=Sphingomonas azotifigens TaxID=330920 RepID=UPI000A009646|nr:alkaline phosphatase D family protein [Sphingomonas azotifigens]